MMVPVCVGTCLCSKLPFSFDLLPVNEMQMLSDDCRYLVLLAKVQNKVDKHEEALLSLQRVSDTIHVAL